MRFIAKYTWSNIKANKIRAILLVFCTAFASLLFFVSLAFPKYLRNYQEARMRSYYGSSDIYMQANDATIASMDDIPTSLMNDLDYAYGFLCLPMSRYSSVTDKDEPITYIAGHIEDVQAFNPVRVLKGDISDFTGKKMIITSSSAKKFGWKVGDVVRVSAYSVRTNFTICAIVANEGLLSEANEATGPIVLLSKDGVLSAIRALLDAFGQSGTMTDEQIERMFNMAVFKVKDGVDIGGITGTLSSIFPSYKVEETVNNKALEKAVSYLNTPFRACIYLVCAFCALIIYLTCKLTFSERVRQFAVLKSMGATTGQVFFSLLLESAFYGVIGGVISIFFGILQVYLLPVLAPTMTYVKPVPAYFYLAAVAFGVFIAVVSSFVQGIKSVRKSIKQTLLYKEKFTKQHIATSITGSVVAVAGIVAMIATRTVSVKVISIPLFLLTLAGFILALPFVLSGAFALLKLIIHKRTFGTLYLEKTLPSKNLSVANRLLFFGVFLVFLFSTLITSLGKLSRTGYVFPYDAFISQAKASQITEENLAEIENCEGVVHSWVGVKFDKADVLESDGPMDILFGLESQEIERLYASQIKNYRALQPGEIYINKYYRDTRGFKMGDKISFNLGFSEITTISFKIVGFIDNYEQWGDMAVALLSNFQTVQNIDGFNTIFVETSDKYEVKDVISNIRKLDFINQNEHPDSDEEATTMLLTFTDVSKQEQIFLNQVKVPFMILNTYSALVLVLSLLCVFIGYVLYLRESTEYHKTLFALGMSPGRFEGLVVAQSVFMTAVSMICAAGLSVLLYFNFENIFNALGTSFVTAINIFEFAMYGVGIFAGTTVMSWGLGIYFKRDLTRGNKRLFG